MNNHGSLGKRISRAREDAGIEQDAAAKALGIHTVTLSRYENDKRPVPPRVRERMAELYGVPLPDEPVKNPSAGSSSLPPPGDVTVALSRDRVFYFRGVLDSELRTIGRVSQTLGGVSSQLDALKEALVGLRGLLDDAVTGVVRAGDVIPQVGDLAEALTAIRGYEGTLERAAAAARESQPADEHRATG